MYMGQVEKSMTFAEASAFYLEWREAPAVAGVKFIAKRTLKDYRQKIKPLRKFFGDMPLETIKVDNLVAYQTARLTSDGYTRFYGKREVQSTAGAIKINAELAFVKRLMKMACCWTPKHEMYYVRFQQETSCQQRALSPEEQGRFLEVAAADPAFHPIWWYALVAIHLTFSSDEMRTIRLGDINLAHQIVGVNPQYGKNKYRRRSNTVEDGACLWALQRLMERAAALCETWPNYKGQQPHYLLFPKRIVRGLYDPELPMSETGLRKIFDKVRVKAQVPQFPFNGFRHTGLTRLAEANTPPWVMEKRAGHVDPSMMRRYVQIGDQAERIAIRNAFHRKPVASVREERPAMRVGSYY